MEREIAPLRDLRTLWKLWRLARRVRPAITNVSAPKAGLLGGLAAWLARVPCRVYTLRGLRLETASGRKYAALWAAEWLACRLAQRVVCVSRGLARRVVELHLARPDKLLVVASGSSNGIDSRRFAPGLAMARRARRLRRRLGISGEAPVLGFVGRLTRDKGIAELVGAYRRLRQQRPSLRLLLVGCFEEGDPVPAGVRDCIERDRSIVVTGFVEDSAPYYQLMNVVVLPTYREGYPTVALEAAAAGRPFITTHATGAGDAVTDGETGLLVPVGDTDALAASVAGLLDDPERAAALACRAQQLAASNFSQQRLWKAIEQVYRDLLARRAGRAELSRAAPRVPGRPTGALWGPAGVFRRPAGGRRYSVAAPSPGWWALSGGKRAMDIAVGGLGLALASPLLLLLAAAVALCMGRPILFRQPRSGLSGKPFRICKFRTLAQDDCRSKATDAQRLTPLGRLLRRWSLDELPQLWNVLRGEMSLVGPRPLPRHYEPRYTARQRRRLDVKPGLTGWAQVGGRNSLSWRQRFELDLDYVEHAGAWLDLQILARSFELVWSGSGVTPHGAALMPEFLGESCDSI